MLVGTGHDSSCVGICGLLGLANGFVENRCYLTWRLVRNSGRCVVHRVIVA